MSILYYVQSKNIFPKQSKIKNFNVFKLKEFITNKPSLQELLNFRQMEQNTRWKCEATPRNEEYRNL